MFRGLTTPSAPTLVAFGIIFLMARPPLLCKEATTFLFNIRSTPPVSMFNIRPNGVDLFDRTQCYND